MIMKHISETCSFKQNTNFTERCYSNNLNRTESDIFNDKQLNSFCGFVSLIPEKQPKQGCKPENILGNIFLANYCLNFKSDLIISFLTPKLL